jgi:hypothetical protein
MDLGTPIKTAFMGIAAININGYTMNSFLDIPIEMNEGGGSTKRMKPWDPDRLQQFKMMYDINNLSILIVDEISMVKPWMLAYLDQRLKEATQVYDKPFGGIAVVMFGDFDQQPPIGGSSLPHFAVKMLEKEYQQKNKIYFTKRTRQDQVEINSTLCRTGMRLFQSAGHLKLTTQQRCARDPEHSAFLTKMSSGARICPDDLKMYKTVNRTSIKDLTELLFATIIVTGNYERQELNAFVAKLWAVYYKTHVIRWKRQIRYDRWKGQPRSDEDMTEAQKQNCFYEMFVPMAPAYLTYNINLHNDLANGSMIRLHSLAFDEVREKLNLEELVASTPIGETIDIDNPPTAVNIEIYPHLPNDSKEDAEKKEMKRNKWKLGSLTSDGTIVVPVGRKTGKYNTESIRQGTHPYYFGASTVPIADNFPIELGFCITVPKAQGRTIHKLIVSLSEHPSPFLRFKWEQAYVVVSRITGKENMKLLLQMGNRDTLAYLSELEKDRFTTYYFQGFCNESSDRISYWNSDLTARVAGFVK